MNESEFRIMFDQYMNNADSDEEYFCKLRSAGLFDRLTPAEREVIEAAVAARKYWDGFMALTNECQRIARAVDALPKPAPPLVERLRARVEWNFTPELKQMLLEAAARIEELEKK